jgi:hypothetical protein
MARRSLTAALGRRIGAVLTADGFREEGLRWFQRSELGDFAVVEIQPSRGLPGLENCFVNAGSVPGPWDVWGRWVFPDLERGESPHVGDGVLDERVQPSGTAWLSLVDSESVTTIGDWLVGELADSVVPRLRRRFDREVLLSEILPATGNEELLRAAFRAEAGDAAGADAVLVPAEEDDENMARFRRWIHEYAAAKGSRRR